jgi:hypothetical protein
MKNKKFITLVLNILVISIILSSSAFAGTDGQELSGAYTKLSGLVGGIGGKIVALISGTFGLISSIAKFNPVAIASFFGVAIGVGSLSFIVDSTVTCLINF